MTSNRRRKAAVRERAANAGTSFTTALRAEPAGRPTDGPAFAPYPFDHDLSTGIPLGLDAAGSVVTWDRREALNLLVAGVADSGPALVRSIVAGCLMTGEDVVVLASRTRSDLLFAKPWCTAWATGTDSAAVVRAVHEEMRRRRAVCDEHGTGSVFDLPADVRPPTMCVVVEAGALAVSGLQRIAATGRSVDVHLVQGSWRPDGQTGAGAGAGADLRGDMTLLLTGIAPYVEMPTILGASSVQSVRAFCASDHDYATALRRLAASGSQVPIGRSEDGSTLVLGPGEHLVVAGRPGAGKTVFTQGFVTSCLLRGADVAVLDFGYGGQIEDAYAFARPYCAEWAANGPDALRVLLAVGAEIERRRSLTGGGAGEKPFYLVVDEVSNLLDPGQHEHPGRAKLAAGVLHELARKAAPVGMHLVLTAQRMEGEVLDLGVLLRPNLARLLLGTNHRYKDLLSVLSDPATALRLGQAVSSGSGIFEPARGSSRLVRIPCSPPATYAERLRCELGPTGQRP